MSGKAYGFGGLWPGFGSSCAVYVRPCDMTEPLWGVNNDLHLVWWSCGLMAVTYIQVACRVRALMHCHPWMPCHNWSSRDRNWPGLTGLPVPGGMGGQR